MSNNDIPSGWAMPDDMAERINEVINRKINTFPFDELRDALDQTAGELAQIEPDPRDWIGWVTYLLEALQNIAQESKKPEDYEIMLKALLDELEIRIKGGRW